MGESPILRNPGRQKNCPTTTLTAGMPRLTINLAYASRKHLSAKVRTFIDFMVEHFARMDYERKWTARFGL